MEDHLKNRWKHRSEPLSPVHILAYAKQILDGLCFLHNLKGADPDAKNIIHGDIKPRNLFLCDHRHGVGYMTIKIGDHDDPGHMRDAVTVTADAQHLRGTLLYMSPELLGKPNKGKIGRRTDSWSLGCVLLRLGLHRYEMEFTHPWFILGQTVRKESSFETSTGSYDFSNFILSGGRPKVPSHLHEDLSAIISDCLVRDQHKRRSAHELASVHRVRLELALKNFLVSEESKLELTTRRMAISEMEVLPKRYWNHGYIILQSEKNTFDNEWVYVGDQLRKSSIEGPAVVIVLRRSSPNSKKLLSHLRHLKDFIASIRFTGRAAYPLDDHLFSRTIFPNLVSLDLDENCEIERPQLETLFTAAPNLVKLFLCGSRLRYWDESTTSSVPKSLKYIEWRLRTPYGCLDPSVLQTLYQMDSDEKFAFLRTYLETNQSLTSKENDGRLFSFADDKNGRKPLLAHSVYESYTNYLGEKVKRQHSIFDVENARPPTVLTLKDVGSDQPLSTVVLKDISVIGLVLSGYDQLYSGQWSEWIFRDAITLIFKNCSNVSIRLGSLKTTFPVLQSIVMDNSTFGYIEENVFYELQTLRHLCLDGSDLVQLKERSQAAGDETLDANVQRHLLKLHFDSRYQWLTDFVKSHHYLIEYNGSTFNYHFPGVPPADIKSEDVLKLDDVDISEAFRFVIACPWIYEF